MAPKKAEGAPDERDRAGNAKRDAARAKRVELRGDEIEPRRKIAKDEGEDGVAIDGVGSRASEQRKGEQKKRKQGEKRIVRDRRRVRKVIAAVKPLKAAPCRQASQPRHRPRAPAARAEPAGPVHRIIMSGGLRRLH